MDGLLTICVTSVEGKGVLRMGFFWKWFCRNFSPPGSWGGHQWVSEDLDSTAMPYSWRCSWCGAPGVMVRNDRDAKFVVEVR